MTTREWLHAAIRGQPRALVLAESVVLVLGIGWCDWLTGYEVSFYPFYAIPILLALWFAGKRAGIAISVLSALAWFCADSASGHLYHEEWLRFWDAIVRLIFFCLVVFAGAAFRDHRDMNRAKIALLEQSRELQKEIVTISEREQRRIGRDLHDSLGQRLVALSLAADLLSRDVDGNAARKSEAAAEIASTLRQTVIRARDLARGLSPVSMDTDGLPSALEDLAETTRRLTGIACSFLLNGSARITDESIAAHLYRIAQEAVTNAAKHAAPSQIIIALDSDEGRIELRISDDGNAAGEGTQATGKGMGLNIMRYRAAAIGAVLQIAPNSPKGTVVTCRIEEVPEPLPPPEARP